MRKIPWQFVLSVLYGVGFIALAIYADISTDRFEKSLTPVDRVHITQMRGFLLHANVGDILVMRDGWVQQVVYPARPGVSQITVRNVNGDHNEIPLGQYDDVVAWRVVRIVTPNDRDYASYSLRFVN